MITEKCIGDYAPIAAAGCADYPWPQRWGYTLDYVDNEGHEVGTLQNLNTGACLDDSAAYGLRAYYCDQYNDSLRIFQQFKLTRDSDGVVLQNMATGSCVDHSDAYGLRGYYCTPNNYFQKWRVRTYY